MLKKLSVWHNIIIGTIAIIPHGNAPGQGVKLGVVLGVQVRRVVGVGEVLVHVVRVLLEAALEPIPRPLQGVLDLPEARGQRTDT